MHSNLNSSEIILEVKKQNYNKVYWEIDVLEKNAHL